MLEHFLQLHEQIQGLGQNMWGNVPLGEDLHFKLNLSVCTYVYIHSKLSLPNTNELVKSSLWGL